jgi:hypothetical protein
MKLRSRNVKDNRYFRGRSAKVGENKLGKVGSQQNERRRVAISRISYFVLSFCLATRR